MYAEVLMKNKSHSKLKQIFAIVGPGNFINDVMTVTEEHFKIHNPNQYIYS